MNYLLLLLTSPTTASNTAIIAETINTADCLFMTRTHPKELPAIVQTPTIAKIIAALYQPLTGQYLITANISQGNINPKELITRISFIDSG